MTAKALFDAGFPTALSDSQATALGLKVYQHGSSYNGGNSPTVTLVSGGGSVTSIVMTEFLPYQTSDGAWRMRFNMRIVLTAVTRTVVTFGINGVTFFNCGGNGQAITGAIYSNVAVFYTTASSNVSTIEMSHTSSAINEYNLSGDVKLASKPTWAY